MSKKITYEENPFGDVKLGKRVFLPGLPIKLPKPAELAEAEKTTKITLSVSKRSLRFFKKQAARHHVPYQAMIRRLLDNYIGNV